MNKDEAEKCCKIANRFNLSGSFLRNNVGEYHVMIFKPSANPNVDFEGVFNYFNVSDFLNCLMDLNKITIEEATLYRLEI